MSNTTAKVKEGFHDAAEKVKDVAHDAGVKVKDVTALTPVSRSRTPRTTWPKKPKTLHTMSARRSRTQRTPLPRKQGCGP